GESAHLHAGAEQGAGDGERRREVAQLQKGRMLVHQMPDEDAAERLAATLLQVVVTGDRLVQRGAQPLHLLHRDQPLAHQVAVAHERLNLFRRGEDLYRPRRKLPAVVAGAIGEGVASGNGGFVIGNAHSASPWVAAWTGTWRRAPSMTSRPVCS